MKPFFKCTNCGKVSSIEHNTTAMVLSEAGMWETKVKCPSCFTINTVDQNES